MTIDKDLNEPQPQIQPPDPVVMYNHTLAVKVEEENTKLRNKVNELNEDIKDLKEARTIITKDYATLENHLHFEKKDNEKLQNEKQELKKLVKLHENAVCNNCDNMEKVEKELEDSKHAYLLMKKEKDSIAHNYEVLDNQVKTGTAKRYYAMEERCKNEEAQKQHYERLMTDYKGQVIEADMFRNSLKKFINGGKRLEF